MYIYIYIYLSVDGLGGVAAMGAQSGSLIQLIRRSTTTTTNTNNNNNNNNDKNNNNNKNVQIRYCSLTIAFIVNITCVV